MRLIQLFFGGLAVFGTIFVANAQETTTDPNVQPAGYFMQVDSGLQQPAFTNVRPVPNSAANGQIALAGCTVPGCTECESGCAASPIAIDGCDVGGCDLGDFGGQAGCIGACSDGGCGGKCGAWSHVSYVAGEALYIRPRNSGVAYAVPIDGPITAPPTNNPIQIGRIGVVDHDYELGFAGTVNMALNPLSSIQARYSSLDFSTSDQISTAAPNVLRSLVSHPSTASISTDFLSASANLQFDYDTIDLVFRHLFVGGDCFAVNYFLGARYGQLDQRFQAEFINNGTETVRTDVDFEGVGLRLGIEAERYACKTQLMCYSRAAANFLAGRFRASYFQGTSFDPEIVNTYWESGCIVPTLDLEVGLGWRSKCDRLKLTVGYRIDAWFNMVTTEDFIYGVQQNNFLDLSNNINFDGLVGRVEYSF